MLEDSPRRCNWCSKRMLQEVDPNYLGPGTRIVHECWSCDHVEFETKPPRLRVIPGGNSGAERLKRVRLGDAPHSA